jgi:hypothetical protein
MSILRLTKRAERTKQLIDYFRGLPEEFGMLKGLLLAGHIMKDQDVVRYRYFFDSIRIAERMDEITRDAKARCLNDEQLEREMVFAEARRRDSEKDRMWADCLKAEKRRRETAGGRNEMQASV